MYVPLIHDIEASFQRLHGLRSRFALSDLAPFACLCRGLVSRASCCTRCAPNPEYFASVLHDLHVQYTSFLMQTVRDAVQDGELPPGTDAELVRSMVWGHRAPHVGHSSAAA